MVKASIKVHESRLYKATRPKAAFKWYLKTRARQEQEQETSKPVAKKKYQEMQSSVKKPNKR